MMFQGIVSPISNDPDFARFEVRLRMQYFVAQFALFNNQLVKAFSNFGAAMKKTAESMRAMLPYLEKLNIP